LRLPPREWPEKTITPRENLFGSYAYGEPGKAMVYDIKEKGIRIE
jgi:hypothetical protein